MTADSLPLMIIGAASVFTGAVSQRSTGVGLALVAAPGIMLLFGAIDGVLVITICGGVGAGVAAALLVRSIDWRMFLKITAPALLLSPLGAWAVSTVPDALVQLVVALLILAAFLVPAVLRRVRIVEPHPGTVWAVGGLMGVLNSAAGVGGPALVAYAVAARWDFATFRATAQPVFFAIGFGAAGSRLALGTNELAAIDWSMTALLVGFTVAGVFTGDVVARKVPATWIQPVSVAIAVAGALAVGVDGAMRIVS